jgi:hypothetical protein
MNTKFATNLKTIALRLLVASVLSACGDAATADSPITSICTKLSHCQYLDSPGEGSASDEIALCEELTDRSIDADSKGGPNYAASNLDDAAVGDCGYAAGGWCYWVGDRSPIRGMLSLSVGSLCASGLAREYEQKLFRR